jgi:CBS domain-containing protein
MREIIVADIMTKNPLAIDPSSSLLECAKVMVKKNTGSLLLLSDRRLVGIISREDILWALVKKSPEELKDIKAIEISPKKIATIRPTAKVEEALRKMKRLKFQRLPVIQKGICLGLITFKDILSFHPELYPEMDEFEKIREEAQKLGRIKKAKERRYVHEGICEECSNVDLLYRINGMLICESCRDSM